jgi:hypothetical protein
VTDDEGAIVTAVEQQPTAEAPFAPRERRV